MDSDALLEARDVYKAFGRRGVLAGVSLTVRRGEIQGIVGENGSGKTTLLRILVGMLAPDQGRISTRGGLGYCPQEPLVFERLTVLENLAYFAAAYGLRSWRASAERLLGRLRFERDAGTRVAEVSGGTRQKLNLALALLHEPALLLLDEPYSGFDWETYLLFWEEARALRTRGCGLVVVSHLVYDRSLIDRYSTLVGGELRCA